MSPIDGVAPTHRLGCQRSRFVGGRGVFGLRCIETEIGVTGEFFGAASGAFGQVAFGQRLQPPNDASDEPGAVAGRGGFAETSAKRCRSWPMRRRLSAATSLTMLSSSTEMFLSLAGANGQLVWKVSLVLAENSRQ